MNSLGSAKLGRRLYGLPATSKLSHKNFEVQDKPWHP